MAYDRSKGQYRFDSSHYQRIPVSVPMGWRDRIKAYAAEHGKTTNEFICDLIRAEMGISDDEWTMKHGKKERKEPETDV